MSGFLKARETPSRAQASSPEQDQIQVARVTAPTADPSEWKRLCTPNTGSRKGLRRSRSEEDELSDAESSDSSAVSTPKAGAQRSSVRLLLRIQS
jgi:hypothetical protein